MKVIVSTLIALLILLFCSCGGLTSNNTFTGPHVSGTWELIATSTTVPGNTLLVESNLAQDGSKVSASGSSILLIGFSGGALGNTAHLKGLCPGNGEDSIAATLSNDGSLSYSLNEGGTTFSGSGSSTSSVMSGTYSAAGTCADSGTFAGILIPSFDMVSFTTCVMPNAPFIGTASIAEKPDRSVIVSGTYGGGTPYILNGQRLGKVMTLTGNFNGQTTQLFAYLYDGNSLYIYDENGQWLGLCSNSK